MPREIAAELGPLQGLRKEVEKQALINAQKQGLLSDERLRTPEDVYYGRP